MSSSPPAADAPATPSAGPPMDPAAPRGPEPTDPLPVSPVPVAAAHAPKPSYVFLAILSAAVLASDLWSKWWAVQNLKPLPRGGKEIIKDRLKLTYAQNPGGAWGMLHDQPEKVRKPFFVIVSLIAVVVIVGMFRKLDTRQRALKWGLPLVLGGALGNLVDRIRYGQVVDFIDVVYWKNKAGEPMHWPTFNVADIAICVGVMLMAIDFIFPHRRSIRVPKAKSAVVTPAVVVTTTGAIDPIAPAPPPEAAAPDGGPKPSA